MSDTRTIISFKPKGDVWPVIGKWARENQYYEKAKTDSYKRYQKGTGFLVAPMMLEVHVDGENIRLEAWVRSQILARIMAFFIIPEEMHIEPGGFKLAIPRKMAREAVNRLLVRLDQPEIQ